MEDRYINNSAVIKTRIKAKVQKWIGWFFTVIFAVAILGYIKDGQWRDIPGALLLTAPFALLLWRGYVNDGLIKLAKSYAGRFIADHDGTMTARELTTMTGKEESRIVEELKKLFDKGFFVNCTLQAEPFAVLMYDTQVVTVGFADVTCPYCGGTSRIRIGAVGQCEYCGSAIQA